MTKGRAMKVQNKNASSLKTKMLIRNVFVDMLAEKKDLHKISVSELVKRAGIHRTTFYVHYSDIYGIIDEMETETIHNLLSSDVKLDSAEKRAAFLKKAFSYFTQQEDLYRILLASDAPMRFLQELTAMAKERIAEGIQAERKDAGDPNIRLKIDLFLDGGKDAFIAFFRGKSTYELPELCDALLVIAREMIG